jgi:hypothetical protein
MYTAALLYIQQHIIYGHGKKILRRFGYEATTYFAHRHTMDACASVLFCSLVAHSHCSCFLFFWGGWGGGGGGGEIMQMQYTQTFNRSKDSKNDRIKRAGRKERKKQWRLTCTMAKANRRRYWPSQWTGTQVARDGGQARGVWQAGALRSHLEELPVEARGRRGAGRGGHGRHGGRRRRRH